MREEAARLAESDPDGCAEVAGAIAAGLAAARIQLAALPGLEPGPELVALAAVEQPGVAGPLMMPAGLPQPPARTRSRSVAARRAARERRRAERRRRAR
jgi:hypothetical protein